MTHLQHAHWTPRGRWRALVLLSLLLVVTSGCGSRPAATGTVSSASAGAAPPGEISPQAQQIVQQNTVDLSALAALPPAQRQGYLKQHPQLMFNVTRSADKSQKVKLAQLMQH